MPSILQQQLQQVTSTWGSSTGKRQRGKPSLLYTTQEAADVDLQSLYELALEGEVPCCIGSVVLSFGLLCQAAAYLWLEPNVIHILAFNTWLSCAGLTQLCTVEARFEPYQNTLFSQAGLETNHDEHTKAENAAMDASIEAYLRLLTDHFLSMAAFQTLEYLIRRYRSEFMHSWALMLEVLCSCR